MVKRIIKKGFLPLVIGLGLIGFIALDSLFFDVQAQTITTTFSRHWLQLADDAIYPLDANDTLGNSSNRIVKGWFDDLDTTTITISGSSSGDITIKKADPAVIYDVTTATDTDFYTCVDDDAGGDDDDKFKIGDGQTCGTNTFLTIDTSGSVGIGTTSPSDLLHVSDSGTNSLPAIRLDNYNDQVGFAAAFEIGKSHTDTLDSLVTTLDTEILGTLDFLGVSSSNSRQLGARIKAIQDGTAGTRIPTDLQFLISDDDSTDLALTLETNTQATFTGSIVASADNHAFGVGAALGYIGNRFTNNFTSDGGSDFVLGIDLDPTMVMAAGDTNYAAYLGVAGFGITTPASETVGLVTAARFAEPFITLGGGGTVTEGATVYIRSAPTEATTNAALWVAEGNTILGNIAGSTGIGVVDPDTKLEVLNAGDQLKLSFDSTDNATFAVDTSGFLTITPSGGVTLIPNNSGLVIGHTAQVSTGAITAELQILGTAASDSAISVGRWSADTAAGRITFYKSRNATIGSFTAVTSGDDLGSIFAYGDDGTDDDTLSSQIIFDTEGTIGTGRVPGVIRFLTGTDAAPTVVTEAMRIDSSQRVGIGTTSPSVLLDIEKATDDDSPIVRLLTTSTTRDVSIGFITTSGNDFAIGIDASDSDKFKISDSTALGTNDRFTIDSSGDVGIGTASPNGLLHLNGGMFIQDTVTIAVDDATPDVSGGNIFTTSANTGATAITDLDTPQVGQIVYIVGGSDTNSSTIADSGNFALSAAFTASLDDVLVLFVQADNDYIELSRVDN
jgi:hypothetical protein